LNHYLLKDKQMETFDLESHLQDAYSRFPEAKHQPVIGLTANYEGIDATLRDRYYKQVIAAGGTPVIIPPDDHRSSYGDQPGCGNRDDQT
jgi:hypothetical protein